MAALSLFEFEPQQLSRLCENDYDDYFRTSENYELQLDPPSRQNSREDDQQDSKQEKEEFDACNDLQFELENEHDPQDEESVELVQNVVHDEEYWARGVDQEPMQDEVVLEPDCNDDHPEQGNYLDPDTFFDFNQTSFKSESEIECFNCKSFHHQEVLSSPAPSYSESTRAPTVMTYDQDLQELDDLKEIDTRVKKVSTKQDGTLAFLRQCILELKAGIDIMFTNEELTMKKALWDYMIRIAKKTEIQKQPKKKR